MQRAPVESQQPVAIGFAAYVCAHVAIFSLIGLLKLPLPGLWWACAALIPSWILMSWLERRGRHQLAVLVGIQACSFAGGSLGVNGRELFCAALAMV